MEIGTLSIAQKIATIAAIINYIIETILFSVYTYLN